MDTVRKIEMTTAEQKFLLELLKSSQFSGTAEQLTAMLQLYASIKAKLEAPPEPAAKGNET